LREHDLLARRQRFTTAYEFERDPSRAAGGAQTVRPPGPEELAGHVVGFGVHRQRMLPLGVEKWQGTRALPGALHA